ncbi:MAG: hypothetical protein IJM30_11335 [Thermoguttaceae bacterium]|nr:hypothetical protein [Thermoguttaceae bacterium]
MTRSLQISTLVLALASALSLGCSKSSNFVSIDDEPEASAPRSTLEIPEASPVPEAPVSAVPAPETPAPEPVASAPRPDEGIEFNAEKASLDLTKVERFEGEPKSEIAQWLEVKVVRGRGALTRKALETLAALPKLTELLWVEATIDADAGDAFRAVVSKPTLKKVRLAGLTLTGKSEFPPFALEALSSAPKLVDLDLSGSALKGGDLSGAFQNGFNSLTKLNLYQAKIGDEGVAALEPLASKLTSLNVDDAGITSKSADAIARFANLTFLHVGRSKLDDEAIAKFAALKKLQKIHVTRSDATEEGAQKLRDQLPGCVVVSQPEN